MPGTLGLARCLPPHQTSFPSNSPSATGVGLPCVPWKAGRVERALGWGGDRGSATSQPDPSSVICMLRIDGQWYLSWQSAKMVMRHEQGLRINSGLEIKRLAVRAADPVPCEGAPCPDNAAYPDNAA